MCGRLVGFRHIKELMDFFPIDVADVEATGNNNVAPTQEVLSIVKQDDQNHLVKLNWGLVPLGRRPNQSAVGCSTLVPKPWPANRVFAPHSRNGDA